MLSRGGVARRHPVALRGRHDPIRVHSGLSCLWGARAGVGPGYTLEAAAVRLSTDIAELRDEGGIPQHVRTVITVLPQQRVLEIRVEGLSVEADPDRTPIREVTHALFELPVDRTTARHADIAEVIADC